MSEPLRNYTKAAEWLGIPRKWLETEVQKGRAPHVRFGKYVMFTQQHLDTLVATHERGAAMGPAANATGPRSARPPMVTRRG